MHQPPNRTSIARLLLVALAILLLGACSDTGSSTPTPAPTSLAARPSSTARLTIVAPRNGQTISRQASEVRLGDTSLLRRSQELMPEPAGVRPGWRPPEPG